MVSNGQDLSSSLDEILNDFDGSFFDNDFLPLDLSGDVNFDEWTQGVEADDNVDTTSSFPAQTSTHQGALDVVDKHAPGTSASSSVNISSLNNPKALSEAQDPESPGALNAVGAPTSLGPTTPNKRKRTHEDSAYSPLAAKTRKRKGRNPSLHQFPQHGSPSMIIDGEPIYVAQAPQAPAPAQVPAQAGLPSSSKTTKAADGLFNFNDSERYLDSNRMRQIIKNGLADTVGINEGDKWECRLSGGMYVIECLRDRLCSMQWFGEVVLV